VQDAVKEGVVWGTAVALLAMVTPPRTPSDPHGGERVIYSLVFGLTLGITIAVDKSEEVVNDSAPPQLQERMASRRRWRGILTLFLFPIPLLITWLVLGRISLSEAGWSLLFRVLAVARIAFRWARTPPS
jgi:hypothetical protein